MKKSNNRKITGEVLSVAVVLVVFLALLAFVVFAANSYKSSVNSQQERDEERTILSYISTAVRSDRADLISIEMINDTETLVILDQETGLERRISYRNGDLVEKFGMRGQEFSEDGETVIGHPAFIKMNIDEDGLLVVKTDLGTAYVRTGCPGI